MTTTRKQFHNLDLLKTIAIYFVLVYHFDYMNSDIVTDGSRESILNYMGMAILSTCVPIFFFVNGGLLITKPNLDLRKHFSKTLQIVLLTLIWGVITVIALSLIWDEPKGIREIFRTVFELRQRWVSHLWFMEALVVIYFLYPLIHLAYHKHQQIFLSFLAIICLFSFGNFLIGMGGTLASEVTGKFSSTDFLTNHFSEFNPLRGLYGFSIGYFLLGGFAFQYKDQIFEKVRKPFAWGIMIVSTLLLGGFGVVYSLRENLKWDVVFDGYESIFTLLNVLALFIITYTYAPKGWSGKLIRLISENTLGIYFLHWILGCLISPMYEMVPFHNSLLAVMTFSIVVLLFSLGTAIALKKVPIVNRLFSIG